MSIRHFHVLEQSHILLPLEKLTTSLVEDDVKAKIIARDDDYEKIFKHASKASSEYESKTSEMIQFLHSFRDKQVCDYWNIFLNKCVSVAFVKVSF